MATMAARKKESAVSKVKIVLRVVFIAFLNMRRGVICFKFRAAVLTMSDLTKERNMRGQRFLAAAVILSGFAGGAMAQVTNPITNGTLQTNLFRIANIPTATQTEPIDL